MKSLEMSQLLIRLEPQLKQQISHLARSEGKNLSALVRELMLNYIKEKDIRRHMSILWENISREFHEMQITESDIEKAIREQRAENAKSKA